MENLKEEKALYARYQKQITPNYWSEFIGNSSKYNQRFDDLVTLINNEVRTDKFDLEKEYYKVYNDNRTILDFQLNAIALILLSDENINKDIVVCVSEKFLQNFMSIYRKERGGIEHISELLRFDNNKITLYNSVGPSENKEVLNLGFNNHFEQLQKYHFNK